MHDSFKSIITVIITTVLPNIPCITMVLSPCAVLPLHYMTLDEPWYDLTSEQVAGLYYLPAAAIDIVSERAR